MVKSSIQRGIKLMAMTSSNMVVVVFFGLGRWILEGGVWAGKERSDGFWLPVRERMKFAPLGMTEEARVEIRDNWCFGS